MLSYIEEYENYRAGLVPRPNPFKRGADGKIRSPLGISALVQSDPVLAKKLCAEAGESWKTWFPEKPFIN